MIRLFRAFTWLRWRLFLNAFKGTKRRDTLERVSRAGSAIVPIVLGLVLIPAMCAFGFIAFGAGWKMGSAGSVHPAFTNVVRLVLGNMTIVIVFVPVIRSLHTSETGSSRFLLLPIPKRVLHLITLLAAIGDPWILVLIPALFLLPAGFLCVGAFMAAGVSLLAGILILACFLALSAMVGTLLEWVY